MNEEKHPNAVVEPQAIVDALTASGSPLTDQELADRLGIQEQGRSVLALALAELERDGRIVRNRAGLLLVTARADLLSVIQRESVMPDASGEREHAEQGDQKKFFHVSLQGFQRCTRIRLCLQ